VIFELPGFADPSLNDIAPTSVIVLSAEVNGSPCTLAGLEVSIPLTTISPTSNRTRNVSSAEALPDKL